MYTKRFEIAAVQETLKSKNAKKCQYTYRFLNCSAIVAYFARNCYILETFIEFIKIANKKKLVQKVPE